MSAVAEYRLLIADVYELAGLSRRISEREAAACDTTVARWHVLSAVSDAPASVPAIARRLGQVRQGVQRVVDELVDAGQLARHPNPRHRRSPLVGITEEGSRVLDRLWAASEPTRNEQLAASRLTPAELMQARATLRKVIDALT
jgi:DNA-binding MarR family transcriptional regulator